MYVPFTQEKSLLQYKLSYSIASHSKRTTLSFFPLSLSQIEIYLHLRSSKTFKRSLQGAYSLSLSLSLSAFIFFINFYHNNNNVVS